MDAHTNVESLNFSISQTDATLPVVFIQNSLTKFPIPLPIPPLDGGNVLAALLPRHLAEPFEQLRPWGFLIVIGLAASGILWMFIEPIQSAILSVLL